MLRLSPVSLLFMLTILGCSGLVNAANGAKPTPSASDGGPAPLIVVDQFGYLPDANKIAVVRQPDLGYDAGSSYAPTKPLQLVDAATGRVVVSKVAVPWNAGAVDRVSGDRVWWFDFSEVKAAGRYQVQDPAAGVKSPAFRIAADVYRPVLTQALRTFYYQRAGIAKEARYAGAEWADGASHLGPGQDGQARRYDAKGDATTARDLRGGWYDAGDYNKYTVWAARYVVALLMAYEANPKAFGDDSNIPESGNGVPDVIDEARWGTDWLARMQNDDGSVLSIVALAKASPPSAAKDPSYYGPASTAATLATAQAFAKAAKIFAANPTWGLSAYAADLLRRGERAYQWGVAHPQVMFRNNDNSNGSSGLGSGQQEVDDYQRGMLRLGAAELLFAATAKAAYRDDFDANISNAHVMQWRVPTPWELEVMDTLLDYQALPAATPKVAQAIREVIGGAVQGDAFGKAAQLKKDAYLSFLADYTWGSNNMKAVHGLILASAERPELKTLVAGQAGQWAQHFIHYLHGVNPLGVVYLSNMGRFGAERSVTQLYHWWFAASSPKWGAVAPGRAGPAPGFITGGPNPAYKPDGCCPARCGSISNNVACASQSLSPPMGQPPTKSYKQMNDEWPLNSWEITENSNTYQVNYIRLLSRYVH